MAGGRDLAFMRQTFQEAAYGNLVFGAEIEGARDFALTHAAAGAGNEFANVVAGGKGGGAAGRGSGGFFWGAGHARPWSKKKKVKPRINAKERR
jgi:hypothetical protein